MEDARSGGGQAAMEETAKGAVAVSLGYWLWRFDWRPPCVAMSISSNSRAATRQKGVAQVLMRSAIRYLFIPEYTEVMLGAERSRIGAD